MHGPSRIVSVQVLRCWTEDYFRPNAPGQRFPAVTVSVIALLDPLHLVVRERSLRATASCPAAFSRIWGRRFQ